MAQSSGSGGQSFPAGKLHRAHSKQRPEFSKGSGSMELLFLVLQVLKNSQEILEKKIEITYLGRGGSQGEDRCTNRRGEGHDPGKHKQLHKNMGAPPSHKPQDSDPVLFLPRGRISSRWFLPHSCSSFVLKVDSHLYSYQTFQRNRSCGQGFGRASSLFCQVKASPSGGKKSGRPENSSKTKT